MPRTKNTVVTRKRRKKVLNRAEGYFGSKHALYKTANEQVMRSLAYAYRDRRQRKRNFRKLWISRINAACKQNDYKYSLFISGLIKANIQVNRNMLAEMAVSDPKGFTKLVNIAKENQKNAKVVAPKEVNVQALMAEVKASAVKAPVTPKAKAEKAVVKPTPVKAEKPVKKVVAPVVKEEVKQAAPEAKVVVIEPVATEKPKKAPAKKVEAVEEAPKVKKAPAVKAEVVEKPKKVATKKAETKAEAVVTEKTPKAKKAPAKKIVAEKAEEVAAKPKKAPAKKVVAEGEEAPVKAKRATAKKAPAGSDLDSMSKLELKAMALQSMTLTALKADAKEKGIKGYSAMKKDDLIEVLKHLA